MSFNRTSPIPIDFSTIKNQLWKEHLDEVQRYATCPTLLPEYQKEWLEFVHKRTVMISKLGGNSENYDFKSEFVDIWRDKFNRIMNAKFEKKVKLGQKYFYDGFQPKSTSVIISKVYNEIDKPCKITSPVSSDSSARSNKYRSNSSRWHHSYKCASVSRSQKQLSRASRRSSSSDVFNTSESMIASPNVQSQDSKDRDYYKISLEPRYVHSSKSRSQERYGFISKTRSKKKKSKRKHKNRRSKSKSSFIDPLETKKYKNRKRSSSSKSPSVSHRKLKYKKCLKKISDLNSFSVSSDSSAGISSQRSTHTLKKFSGDYRSSSSSSSCDSRKGRQSQHHSDLLKNMKRKRKYSKPQIHKRFESPLHQVDAKNHVASLSNQKDSVFSNFKINSTAEHKFQHFNKLTEPKSISEECSKDEIQKFFQNLVNSKTEPSTYVKKNELSHNESIDIANTFSKLQFNQYLKSCSANIDLIARTLADSPTMSLKEEMNLFLGNAVIQESIKSLKEKESERCVGKDSLSTNKCKGTLEVAKDNDIQNEICNAFSRNNFDPQIGNSGSSDIEVVCIDSDNEKIPQKECNKKDIDNLHFSVNENIKKTTSKDCQISTSASPKRVQLKTSENIFFSVYKETLVYLKTHEELLGMYASVIGPLLLDLCSTYGTELTFDHQIALTLILDMLRLNLSIKPLSIAETQYHKEAMSKIENVLLHYSGIETDYDSYPLFLYGYDVNDLASKMLNKNSTETKKFIDCLLLQDGFEYTNLEPFSNLYEQVEIKKAKMGQIGLNL